MNPSPMEPTVPLFRVDLKAPQAPVPSPFAANLGTTPQTGFSGFACHKFKPVQGAPIKGVVDTKAPTPAPPNKPAAFQILPAVSPGQGEDCGPANPFQFGRAQPAASAPATSASYTCLTAPNAPTGPPSLGFDYNMKRHQILRKCFGRLLCGGAFGDLTIYINHRKSISGTPYEPTTLSIPTDILLTASPKFQGE